MTLAVDEASQARLQALRDAHFPPAAHVTVQNKVEPAVARGLVQELTAVFSPWRMTATGVHVWRYLGGPWEPVGTVLLGR